MFNIWTTLSTLTAINVMDYYNDKARLEREQLHEYAVCFDELGKNIEEMGRAINSVMEKSGRYDLEQAIVQGEFQLPIYIFMQIVRAQQKPVSNYQHKLIDSYFDNIKDSGIDRYTYLSSLTTDANSNAVRDELYTNIGLTDIHCGTFWDRFIEMLYEADDADSDFECIVRNYAEVCWRFAILGDCSSKKAESVFRIFSSGLQIQLELAAQIKRPGSEEKLRADMITWLDKIRDNCREVAAKGGERDFRTKCRNGF